MRGSFAKLQVQKGIVFVSWRFFLLTASPALGHAPASDLQPAKPDPHIDESPCQRFHSKYAKLARAPRQPASYHGGSPDVPMSRCDASRPAL